MNFEVPEIGEGVQEGELIAWKIKVGDSIKMDAPLVEIMDRQSDRRNTVAC